MLIGMLISATLASAGAPELDIQLGPDWAIVDETPTELRLRHKTSADGVLIVHTPTPGGRQVGVAPIRDGRTLELTLNGQQMPAFAWPYPDQPPSTIRLEGQGPDLLVRLEGPPLSELSSHPSAPADPVLSWVRLRPRGATWRIALRGVHRWILPSPTTSTHEGRSRILDSPWGRFDVYSEAVAHRGHTSAQARVWDTSPCVGATSPYPQTGITWTP